MKKITNENSVRSWRHSFQSFVISSRIQKYKIYHVICHMCALQVPITVTKNTRRHSSSNVCLKMYCVIVVMSSSWWTVFKNKSNLNIMVAIGMYLLNSFHCSTSLLCNILVYFWYQVICHVILCFVHFYLIAENSMLPLQLHIVNTSFNC